jgi:hypothetical protein
MVAVKAMGKEERGGRGISDDRRVAQQQQKQSPDGGGPCIGGFFLGQKHNNSFIHSFTHSDGGAPLQSSISPFFQSSQPATSSIIIFHCRCHLFPLFQLRKGWK